MIRKDMLEHDTIDVDRSGWEANTSVVGSTYHVTTNLPRIGFIVLIVIPNRRILMRPPHTTRVRGHFL
jgi:hypothetical protein